MKSYPAKLLLFGEHTVNTGSQALAVPLPLFSGKWQFATSTGKAELAGRQMKLPQFVDWLEHLSKRKELLCEVDTAAFWDALRRGLIFESNIPTGYGAGSSGALVAAVFGEWTKEGSDWASGTRHQKPQAILKLKNTLAQLEGFFHGTSSGTDPLICFLQQPVLLGGHAGVRIPDLPDRPLPEHPVFFLLDTGQGRDATPLIAYFLEKMKEPAFYDRCKQELVPVVDSAISAFLSGDRLRLFEDMHRIGEFQLLFFEKLIPEAFRPLWKEGLEGELFKLKTCGAGGGGFLLGITNDFAALQLRYPNLRMLSVVR